MSGDPFLVVATVIKADQLTGAPAGEKLSPPNMISRMMRPKRRCARKESGPHDEAENHVRLHAL